MKKQDKKSKNPDLFVPTPAQLLKLAVEWQSRLRLNDWNITVQYVSPDFMPDVGIVGTCQCQQNHKTARVRLLHPKHYPGQGMTYSFRDMEHTLVHEFMHIHLDGMEIPKARERDEEQVINIVSGALIGAKYNIGVGSFIYQA